MVVITIFNFLLYFLIPFSVNVWPGNRAWPPSCYKSPGESADWVAGANLLRPVLPNGPVGGISTSKVAQSVGCPAGEPD